MASKKSLSPTLGISIVGVQSALIFLVALNLRPALASVGPLLPQIGTALALSKTAQGMLGSIPLVAFALVSPLVYLCARRIGVETSILVSLLLLMLGIAVRSYAGSAGMWVGTALVGCAIAVGNVLVPVLVKRDYSRSVSFATGMYSACINIGAASASVVSVLLAAKFGWSNALAVWGLLVALAALLWAPRARRHQLYPKPMSNTDAPKRSIWKEPTAWLVTAFMGLQSSTFYFFATWLPTIDVSHGATSAQSGWHLFIYQIIGIVSALLIPRLMGRSGNQVVACLVASVPVLAGIMGIWLAPGLIVFWAVLAGLGSGASLAVALTLISMRGGDHGSTTQLSGMAQSIGYLFAALAPTLAGALTGLTGNWSAALVMMAVFAALQALLCFKVGSAPSLGSH